MSLAQRLLYSRLSNAEPLAADDGDVGRKLVKKSWKGKGRARNNVKRAAGE
jgi:hypothetical protein